MEDDEVYRLKREFIRRHNAEWMRSFISEVPVGFVAMPEPYWRPDDPRS